MDNRPIGVFDSGLGGLTVVRQLLSTLPGEDIVYFGDTGRVPYGTRSPETIEKYTRQDCRFLLSKGVKLIIAAGWWNPPPTPPYPRRKQGASGFWGRRRPSGPPLSRDGFWKSGPMRW